MSGLGSVFKSCAIAACIVILAGSLCLVMGQGGKGGGKGGRPGGDETTMNLSYPAHFYKNPLQSGLIGSYKLDAAFPDETSYGCDQPETIGTTTFPNTSCVKEETPGFVLVLTPAECVDPNSPDAKCKGYAAEGLERIYWQKSPNNKWQGGYYTSSQDPLPVEFVDWGDNLEGKTWPIQVLRVETNTFSSVVPTIRFDMWHVTGRGTTELWGLHTTNPQNSDPAVPYVYDDFPYAVNVSSKARLNIAKLEYGKSNCPAVATGESQSPYAPNWVRNADGTGYWATNAYTADLLYGAELNIKGSYVFGYNWNVPSEPVPTSEGEAVDKAGWWRLTFYTPDDSIDFSTWEAPTAGKNTLAPPLSDILPAPMTMSAVPTAESETGLLLYVPIVDKGNNLTYLDICLRDSKGGGGGGGGGKGPKP